MQRIWQVFDLVQVHANLLSAIIIIIFIIIIVTFQGSIRVVKTSVFLLDTTQLLPFLIIYGSLWRTLEKVDSQREILNATLLCR